MRHTIFLTGATGHMGSETLKQLLEKPERFFVKILVMPTEKDKKVVRACKDYDNVEIIYGDLTNYIDVEQGVKGADYVLHVGGMVSPVADYMPEKTMEVNVGGVKNIIKAIKAQPEPDNTRLVYIGTVAQTGDRRMPLHWGRTGDPIKVSKFDYYAVSKCRAELAVIESGLKHWVSLRQTGMLHPDLFKTSDPIMFHVPINEVLEWSSDVDSGRLLVNLCSSDPDEHFWRHIYNIGGGEDYRVTNWEFLKISFAVMGINDFTKYTDSRWFCTRNFHGQWFSDSDKLEDLFHFRSASLRKYVEQCKKQAPWYTSLVKIMPAKLVKTFYFERLAYKELGPMHWIKTNNQERIKAAFGSKEKWQKLSEWENFELQKPSKKPITLNHGYDESKPAHELNIDDMRQAAKFRGGKCLSPSMEKGDLTTPLEWENCLKKRFKLSPRAVLLGGYFCPQNMPEPWEYEQETAHNKFLAQVCQP